MSGHHRTRYSTPKKGTKTRQLLLMLLRPQGATMLELQAELGWKATGTVRAGITMLGDYGGWDVRQFPVPNLHPTKIKPHRMITAYRIVGRDRWGGGYRSLVHDAR